MCGIAGQICPKGCNVVPFLVNALSKLNNRGYSGYGIYLQEPNLTFKVGEKKLNELITQIQANVYLSNAGVAHNRWATHGVGNDVNAHPHTVGRITIVHNGLIDGYQTLRKDLEKKGYKFLSETDTEVFAGLIDSNLKDRTFSSNAFFEAVKKSILSIESSSTFAVLVFDSQNPEKIIAARQGSSPLLWSFKEGSTFIASEEAALHGYVESYGEIEEGIITMFSAGRQERTESFAGEHSKMSKKKFQIDEEHHDLPPKKGDHYMQDEIFSLPSVLRGSLSRRISEDGIVLGGLDKEEVRKNLKMVKKFFVAGCGTSYNASLIIADAIVEIAGIEAYAVLASEVISKKTIFDPSNSALVVVSQSGETADIIALMKAWKPTSIPMYGIVNVPNSTIARDTDAGIYCHVGREVAVASTKAFLGEIICGILFALHVASLQGKLNSKERESYANALLSLPNQIAGILFQQKDELSDLALEYKKVRNFLFIGRGYNAYTAYEGALKLKEVTWSNKTGVNALGIPAGEMKHGTLAMIDRKFPTFVIAPNDMVFKQTMNNVEEILARNGPVILVTDKKLSVSDEGRYKKVFYMPETLPALTPLLSVVYTHLFAYYSALFRGLDPDMPRNLAKAVTVQ